MSIPYFFRVGQIYVVRLGKNWQVLPPSLAKYISDGDRPSKPLETLPNGPA